jgi:hypothetical protein
VQTSALPICIFQPGYTGAAQGLDFSITTAGDGSTAFGVNSVAIFDLWSTTGSDQSANPAAADLLQVAGNLQITSGAALVFGNPNSLTFQEGDVFRVFDWSAIGTVTGQWTIDATNLNLGDLMLDTSDLYTDGTVAVVVPEPSGVMMALLGLTTFAFRRRRH